MRRISASTSGSACTVTTAQPAERFSWTVGDRYDGTPATCWDIEIEAIASGCRIRQEFQHLPRGLSGIRHEADADPARADEIVRERVRDLTAAMNQTLQRTKRVLESTRSSAPEP